MPLSPFLLFSSSLLFFPFILFFLAGLPALSPNCGLRWLLFWSPFLISLHRSRSRPCLAPLATWLRASTSCQGAALAFPALPLAPAAYLLVLCRFFFLPRNRRRFLRLMTRGGGGGRKRHKSADLAMGYLMSLEAPLQYQQCDLEGQRQDREALCRRMCASRCSGACVANGLGTPGAAPADGSAPLTGAPAAAWVGLGSGTWPSESRRRPGGQGARDGRASRLRHGGRIEASCG
jgi:hypothetical protein